MNQDSGQQPKAFVGHGAKYTQGFVFHHDETVDARVRKMIERSAAAVSALMREALNHSEKQLLEGVRPRAPRNRDALDQQSRSLHALRDLVRSRKLLERSVIAAMTCAFAELAHGAHDLPGNLECIDREREELEAHFCESLDLFELLQVGSKTDYLINSSRPLLVHLSAQLAELMGVQDRHLSICPFSPAVFLGGFVLGLQCMPTDLATRKILLENFERSFLSRLAILINSITVRLEEEGITVQGALGFEEHHAGRLLQTHTRSLLIPEAVLRERLQSLEEELPDSAEALMGRLDELKHELEETRRMSYRYLSQQRETLLLQALRREVASFLNASLKDHKLPAFLHGFLSGLWSDVLYDAALIYGMDSGYWQDLQHIQQRLLESIRIVSSEEQHKEFLQWVSELLRSLRSVLDDFGYRYAETSDFFDSLKGLHLQILQEKASDQDWISWSPLPLDDGAEPYEGVMRAGKAAYLTRLESIFF